MFRIFFVIVADDAVIIVEAAGVESSLHLRHFAFACVTTVQNSVLSPLVFLHLFAE
jgi:uncharacterized membrane protein